MTQTRPIKLVLCWHMHQPDYRDHIRDEFLQPWVYLHAMKDYSDMAAHLENHPGARAVVNFSPILLEQLQVYAEQISGFLNNSAAIRDPLLAALGATVFPVDADNRYALIKACLRANPKHQVERFSEYKKLVRIATLLLKDNDDTMYLSNQFIADLVVWYHLAWFGEIFRRTNKPIQALIEQGSGYTLHQRRGLLQIIGDCIAGLGPRYGKLASNGQVELATSPYTHPMLPLLLNFNAAREAQTDTRLPLLAQYPGGLERARWHLQKGIAVFEQYFGLRPTGCWPSEGGVSDATLQLIAEAGFKWSATGENVVRNSLNKTAEDAVRGRHIYQPLCHKHSGIYLFARDDSLSDLIGFTYADWHADDAVANLIGRIEAIANDHRGPDNLLISIIMDGENAWEYYPENGYYFLSTLYERLTDHAGIKLVTYSDMISNDRCQAINDIVAGSWVYGNFSTWIGDPDKNRAWDILGEAKQIYDQVCRDRQFTAEHLDKVACQLAACEGSDWFWWFGDYNPAQTVSDFERLYRTHLVNLYQMLSREPPQYLTESIAHGSGNPEMGGVMRPGESARA